MVSIDLNYLMENRLYLQMDYFVKRVWPRLIDHLHHYMGMGQILLRGFCKGLLIYESLIKITYLFFKVFIGYLYWSTI
ncbi:hypothetical protein SRABI96_04842 [Peribacillus sp. Bi96]|nr:hypothetical protein SRABI96_04842 [Peribacillus sp. Bi96]